MLVMAPVVLFINGFTKGDWVEVALFALSVAVGLTPEMLPMIVTTCLAKGAVPMSRKKTIIKNLNSIQNLGSMDILCTDKTGTITQDKVVLQYHLNIHGQKDARILRNAFLNSYYQTGLKNLMNISIIERTRLEEQNHPELCGLAENYTKIDEIPFDFERRRMSVVVSHAKIQMITKGAVEEILTMCSFAEFEGKVMPLTDEIRTYIRQKVDELNDDGMRVIAVAQKTNPSPVGTFSVANESNMVLIGYLAFLDPPKESTAKAIEALQEHGVAIKILTGDNEKVTRCICRQVGIPAERIVLGPEVDSMTDVRLGNMAQRISLFAKLSPQQKTRIITALRNSGHSVGFLGDGINDAAGMNASNMDKDFLGKPRKWDASSIEKFMLWIGPTSSMFDITTYLLMYLIICPMISGGLLFHEITDPVAQAYFIAVCQVGWFVESMWSQTLVIHMIRTPRYLLSKAGPPHL